MDEVAVYSSAVSAGDIATIYSLRGVAQSASAATITGNLIGTNAAGTAALANGNDGIDLVGSSFNVIGGTTAGAGNVISGNTSDGVEITGSGTTGNVVAGNLIGTDVTGTVALGNGSSGVLIDTGASANLIGGTTASARNIISANADSGVQIYDANDNLVEGNYIGTDKTGTVALGNNQGSGTNGFEFGGVTIDYGSSGNTVGGLTATPGSGAGNVISGNTFAGVLLVLRRIEQFSGRQSDRHRLDRHGCPGKPLRSRIELSAEPASASSTRPTPSWVSRAGAT